ncbi:NAD(P)H-dependent flavin oxidoreductase [Chloroflexota bacterium]
MFETWITEKLGVKYPVIQGAMHGLARAELTSAVSNAGGLGIINANSFASPDELRREIRQTREMTDQPFGVNITLGFNRSNEDWGEYIGAVIEEGVKILETSLRNPEPYLDWLRQSGVTVMHKVARIKDAVKAEKIGVDAVTIVGFECGGHPGMDNVGSMVLVPRLVDSVKIPVIAGGGFADGRGLAAALALGAQGIMMGTRFLATRESPLHPDIKELLLQAEETDTLLIERSIKAAARVIKTDYSSSVLKAEENGVTREELFNLINRDKTRQAYASGDINAGVIYGGQAAGLIYSIPTAKELLDGIIDEATAVCRRLHDISS